MSCVTRSKGLAFPGALVWVDCKFVFGQEEEEEEEEEGGRFIQADAVNEEGGVPVNKGQCSVSYSSGLSLSLSLSPSLSLPPSLSEPMKRMVEHNLTARVRYLTVI